MLGLDFSNLPPSLQWVAAIGAFLGGLYMMLVRGRHTPVTDPGILAAQLADAQLRNDLVEVLRASREALGARIDAVTDDLREDLRAAEERASRGRAELHVKIGELDRRVSSLAVELARIKNNPRR